MPASSRVRRVTRRLAELLRVCQGSKPWRCRRIGRRAHRSAGSLAAAGPGPAVGIDVSPPPRVEVVVTGIPRPIQLALDADGRLVVLSQGWRGDAAGEIYRRRPPRLAAGGRDARAPGGDSLRRRAAQDELREPRRRSRERRSLPRRGERQSHLSARDATSGLQVMAVGLNHLLGGSAIALDPTGTARLHRLRESGDASSIRDAPAARRSTGSRDEGYRGPRGLPPRPPRASGRSRGAPTSLVPIFPRARKGRHRPRAALAAHRRGVAPDDDLVFLSAVGEVFEARVRRRAPPRRPPARRALPSDAT